MSRTSGFRRTQIEKHFSRAMFFNKWLRRQYSPGFLEIDITATVLNALVPQNVH